MNYLSFEIQGVPYSRNKPRGDREAPARWSAAVIEQTQSLPHIKEACIMRVTYMLPPDKFPADFPYGPDLDNLNKRFLDALGKTIFSEAKGGDSCVIELSASKTRVASREEAGARVELLPICISGGGKEAP